MEQDQTAARVRELEILIKKHQDLYYNAEPEISDEAFDALWDELARLDPNNSLLKKVGEDRLDGWPKARHLIPMGSQSKAADPESFSSWAMKNPSNLYLVQYKLDGASIELQYKNGRLEKAVTRGDGIIGDDITPNALRMIGVTAELPIPFTGGVRGEVLMSHEIHRTKYADKANCRNAANGLMKRKDGTGSEDLQVICYDAAGMAAEQETAAPDIRVHLDFKTEMDKLGWLEKMGFTTVPSVLLKSPEEIIEYRGKIMAIRKDLPFDIDGLVIKLPEIDPEDAAKPRPEKQIAFKFSLEEAVTTLVAIEWSESGVNYTPIGIVEPVRLAGTTVQRANLCNPDMIRTMRLKIGSRVVIVKRGEIIPKIETLVENPPDAEEIGQPEHCSRCGTALVDEGTRLYCPNPACPKRALHRIEKWISTLDIRELGDVLIQKLFDAGKLRSIADLYRLTAEDLERLERMGPVLARKIIRSIEAVREIPLEVFLAGLDIEGVGPLVARNLVVNGFNTLEKLLSAREEDFLTLDGIGLIMAKSIVGGLKECKNEIEEILMTGKIRIQTHVADSAEAVLAGKSFCFTGELVSMKRQEAEKLVARFGGTTKSSITKDLSYLVTNEPGSGSEKNKKARQYGIPVINETEFLALIDNAKEQVAKNE